MTAHGGVEFGAAGTGFQFQFNVERDDFEKIAMRSGGRTWSAVIAFTKIICALDSGSGRTVLGHSCRFWIDVPDDPVRKQTARRIRIIDNQDQRFRFIRDATDLQFRTDVRSVTGEFRGNIAASLKGGNGDRDRRVSIEALTPNKRSRWKSNEEQRNVASPWQAKGKQLIKICAQRFCDSFRSRNIGRWIKSKSPMRLVMAQRDGTKYAASSAISNRQAKSRVLERIDMSCPTRPILSLER